MKPDNQITRRDATKGIAAFTLAAPLLPSVSQGAIGVAKPATRLLGRTGFEATTFGLGGQASLEKEPAGIDPVAIVLKAYNSGVNYYDTSNVYGPSQRTFGKAFRQLGLVPGLSGYSETKRRGIFLTSKTNLRFTKGTHSDKFLRGSSQGGPSFRAMDDVRRSLTQIFGDGKGNYPKGAYLDMVLIHHLFLQEQIGILREGLIDTDPNAERIGALAGLRDLRDGTNLTGLNPKEEKLIRHIGFSGHNSAPVMMEMIRRDEENLFDAMLVAINANDHNYTNMQHNAIPVAAAKNMGVIGMKVFAGGGMYVRDKVTRGEKNVIFSVGSERMPSRQLMEYTLTTPGVHIAITGIGAVSDKSRDCQLTQNISAAQVDYTSLSQNDRLNIEKRAGMMGGDRDGKTNIFQMEETGLTAVTNPQLKPARVGGRSGIELTWDTAIAGDEPIQHYNIRRNGKKIATIPHVPQTTTEPFRYADAQTGGSHEYRIETVDVKGNTVSSEVQKS